MVGSIVILAVGSCMHARHVVQGIPFPSHSSCPHSAVSSAKKGDKRRQKMVMRKAELLALGLRVAEMEAQLAKWASLSGPRKLKQPSAQKSGVMEQG